MSLQTAVAEPLKPRQVVIVFTNCPNSGASLHYYGSIVRVLYSSVLRHPSRADLWVYRVLLPFFGGPCDLRAGKLVVTGSMDPPSSWAEPDCEVQFDAEPARDNAEIHGAYRLPGHDWDYFVFRKCDQPRASYRLRMPLETLRTKASLLCYSVPRNGILDRDYVLRAVGEILGVEAWKSDSANA